MNGEGHPWKHVEFTTSVEGVLLFVGGNQGKEFTPSPRSKGVIESASVRHPSESPIPGPSVLALGHTCGERRFVQERLTAAVIRRT
jgi:hypothetical protein